MNAVEFYQHMIEQDGMLDNLYDLIRGNPGRTFADMEPFAKSPASSEAELAWMLRVLEAQGRAHCDQKGRWWPLVAAPEGGVQ